MAATRRDALKLLAAATLAAPAAARAADLPSQVTLDWAYYNPGQPRPEGEGLARGRAEAVRHRRPLGAEPGLEQGARVPERRLASTSARPPVPPPCWPRSTATRSRRSRSTPSPSGPRWSPGPTPASPRSRTCKGKRIAVTSGTDPYIFLLRALDEHGLAQRRPARAAAARPGPAALERRRRRRLGRARPDDGRDRARAGLSLFFRDADANTYGVLNVREAFAGAAPGPRRARARRSTSAAGSGRWRTRPSSPNPGQGGEAQPEVAAQQLERTDFSNPRVEAAQRQPIIAAGKALQDGGVIKPDVDVAAPPTSCCTSFAAQLAAAPVIARTAAPSP